MARDPQSGAALQVYNVFDFRKGEDLKTSALQLAVQHGQNALRRAKNCVYTAAGAVSARLDQTIINSSSVGASVAITGGIQFVKSDGTSQIIFGGDDGKLYKLNTDGTTTTQVTGLTTGKRNYFTVYNDKLLWGNAADAPKKYDGTTWAALGGTPPADGYRPTVHGNRVFWLKPNSSLLTWSALNSEEDYTTASNAGSVLVSANDGGVLVDLVPSINELILLKSNRPYRLQGTSPSTFAITNVVPTTSSKGAISTMGAVFAVNDVWFAADNGFVNLRTSFNFGDLTSSFASDKISPRWEPDSGFTLSLNQLSQAVTCYDSQFNRVYLAVDSDNDGHNDLLLVLDLHTNAWSFWDNQSIASMWPVRNSTNGRIEIYAGGYDGNIRVLNRNVSTNAFTAEARHLSALGKPGLQKSPRHAYFYFKEQGNYSVSIDTKFDFGATGGQTYTASLLGGAHTLGVNWTLGIDPLGKKDQIVKRIDLSGVGEFLEVGVKTSAAGQPFTWYGYEVFWRTRRAIRPSSSAS